MSSSQKRHRIFVVDDEPVIAQTMGMILGNFGFDATSFTEPLKALEACRSHSPDLLISDVMMPGINGIELAIQLLKISPECKVLLFSGQAATVDLLEAARSRGTNFEVIAKPVPPRELLRRIEHELEFSQASRSQAADITS
jgi:DNA-binding NtrC family response regulator